MRILISAFACAPGRGSEPNVGWNMVQQAARENEVWILTHQANRAYIETTEEPAPGNIRFIYIDFPLIVRSLGWRRWSHHVCYFLWQITAYRLARYFHHERSFDIVHHATYATSWMPTLMGSLGCQFIWSAGNVEITPTVFFPYMSWQSRADETARNALMQTLGQVTRQKVGRQAYVILSASQPARWPRGLPVRHFPLGGLDRLDFERLVVLPRHSGPVLRIASIGRLHGLKGFSLGLHAFACFHRRHPHSEYWIIGDGPERQYLEHLAVRLGCRDAVRFWGSLPRQEVLARLADIDVLVHPSLHESFGYVVIEAMAAGTPVICLDTGGPACLVTKETGFCIPVSAPEVVIDQIAQALDHLATDTRTRQQMGEAARVWVREHWTWDAVGNRLRTVYQEAVSSREAHARLCWY